MHTLTTLLLVVSVLTAATIGATCWLAVRTARRTARRLAATLTRRLTARPTQRRTRHPLSWHPPVPRAVQLLIPGTQVSAVRRELARDVTVAARAARAGRRAGRPVQELEHLTARLRAQAAELDRDLAVVAAEPDGTRRRRLLADLQPEVAAVRSVARQVCDGVHLAADLGPVAARQGLADEVRDEVQRLALWASSYRELRSQR